MSYWALSAAAENCRLSRSDFAQYQLHLTDDTHFMQVNYKNVMKQYNLGPNGGILTSLNLFATRFDQVCNQMHCKIPHQLKAI